MVQPESPVMSSRTLIYLVTLGVTFNIIEAFLPHELTQYKDECIEDLKLDPSKFVKPEHPPPESHVNIKQLDAIDHDGKCLWLCLMQKYGSVNDKYEYQLDKVKKLIPQDVVDEIDFEKCTSLEDEDPCEKSFKRSRCIAKQVFAANNKLTN